MIELENVGPPVLLIQDLYKQQLVESVSETCSPTGHSLEEAVVLTTSQSATISNSEVSHDILSLLKKMTTEEKVVLLSGVDFVHTAGIQRLNIPALKVSIPISLGQNIQFLICILS